MMTYSDLKAQFLRNINFVSTTDTNILADFAANLGQRYQLMFAKLANYVTQTEITTATVVGQQYYDYPLSIRNIEDVVVTVGSVNYPLDIINSQHNWDLLNAIQLQAAAIPQFIFPRSPFLSATNGGGFGIWPTPQQINTISFKYHYRDRDLSVDDYTTGTVTATNANATITGAGTTFTSAMVGRYFQITTTTNTGQGFWYLVTGYTSPTVISISPTFQGATGSLLTYRIGQVPLLPDEGHIVLVDGATADFYGGARKDYSSYDRWNNKFYTGDQSNASRNEGDVNIAGGLIGLINRYADRNDERIINRRPRLNPLSYQVWATRLSS